MYILKSDIDGFASDLVSRCMQTQQERAAQYDLYRKYYLFGGEQVMSDYNKVLAHIDTTSAFIYAPGGTRFYVDLPTLDGSPKNAKAAEAMEQMSDRVSRELNSQWHGDGHDLLAMNSVTWSLVYGTMFEKNLWTRKSGGAGIEAYQITPYNLGVMREDVDDMKQQEVIVHQFYYSADELWRILKLLPGGRAMWDRISFQPAAEPVPVMNTLQTIITSSQAQGPTLTGLATPQTSLPSGLFRPIITQDIARAYEVWVWDDMEDDYRVITVLDPGVVLWNEPNFYLPRTEHLSAAHPFTKFTPWPIEGYFWGMSEVYPIMKLQNWNDDTIADIRRLQKLRVKPAIAASGGFSAMQDERMSALWDPGSMISENPGAKVERLVADMPADVFSEPDKIDAMFRDLSGMKSILQGEGVQGIRGEGHAQTLSRYAGARINKKALAIEQGLIDSGNLKLRLLRRYDHSRLYTEAGMEFVIDQLHDDAQVKVDAHSHSPIFAGDQLAEGMEMFKIGAIDKADLLDLTHLPGKERLKSKSRKRDEAKQKLLQQLMQDPKVADALKRKQAMGAAAG